MRAIRLPYRVARELRHVLTGCPEYASLIAALDSALKPKRAVKAAKPRRAAKAKARKEKVAT